MEDVYEDVVDIIHEKVQADGAQSRWETGQVEEDGSEDRVESEGDEIAVEEVNE